MHSEPSDLDARPSRPDPFPFDPGPLTWSERWDTIRRDPRFGTALLCALGVVAGIVWFRFGQPSESASPSTPTASVRSGATRTPAAATTTAVEAPRRIMVQVAGAVSRPGVVELSTGARVKDAIDAAGGAAGDAVLDRLNLAAKVADGERIDVPRVGDPVAPSVPPGAAGVGSGSATGGSVSRTGAPVNLNTASREQLDALPGIGPSLADAIVAAREQRGGFKSVDDLADVRGIGDKKLADLRPLVTV